MKGRTIVKPLVILNPNAGNGELAKNAPFIIKAFNDLNYPTDVMLTTARGEATEYVLNYGLERDAIICAGGDGTLNETVNGIMRFPKEKRPPIGYIPCGTTNDFAKSLRIPKNYHDAIENIVNGSPTEYDIGKFNDKYFVYVAACGAFSATSYATSQDLKRIFGHLAYLFAGIKELPTIKPHHMKFEFDNGEILEGNYAFGAISNTRNYAGIISLDKLGVNISDGLFEMTLVKLPKDIIDTNKVVLSLFSGNYDKTLITFERFSACKITIDSHDLTWTLDGEKGEVSKIYEVANLRKAVRFITKAKPTEAVAKTAEE